jgi:protein-tyrosine phosphatase
MKLLFVCTGNICRSPTAQGIMEDMIENAGLDITCDSAGTYGLHAGEPPDQRAIKIASEHGIDISRYRARQIEDEDFEYYDIIFALDDGHLQAMKAQKPTGARAQLKLFAKDADVPDPWYGEEDGFHQTYDMIARAAESVFAEHCQISGDIPNDKESAS